MRRYSRGSEGSAAPRRSEVPRKSRANGCLPEERSKRSRTLYGGAYTFFSTFAFRLQCARMTFSTYDEGNFDRDGLEARIKSENRVELALDHALARKRAITTGEALEAHSRCRRVASHAPGYRKEKREFKGDLLDVDCRVRHRANRPGRGVRAPRPRRTSCPFAVTKSREGPRASRPRGRPWRRDFLG